MNPNTAANSLVQGGKLATVTRLSNLSRYARQLLVAEPALSDELHALGDRPYGAEEMQAWLAAQPMDDDAGLRSALRRLRKRVLLRVMLRDLNGLADLAEVTGTMSALAETAVEVATALHHRWLVRSHGEPRGEESGATQQLLVVAMGKLGGCELNVSSDIDLIFLYPEAGETAGPRTISNHEFFILQGRRLIGSLSEMTGDGYVFRVDMRLRPYGQSGALVASFAMLEEYLVVQARAWERYAWIKARPIAGDRGDELRALTSPFVFRKYLDFGAIADLRSLHTQIREEARRRDYLANIKLGPGGIREIEFVAQVFQLIRGGREPALQIIPTLQVLALLKARGLLPAAAVEELQAAYLFLRNLEHRLQYLDDTQTQRLPDKPEDCALIAEAMGFADYVTLLESLDMHRDNVSHHFEAVFAAGDEPETNGTSRLWDSAPSLPEATTELAQLGYADPSNIARRLAALRESTHYRRLPDKSRARLDRLVPRVIETAAEFPSPDTTLLRMLDLLEAVDQRESYLALLSEYPPVLGRIAKLASVSAWAAEYLRRHPILLDEFLDLSTLLAPPDWAALEAALDADLAHHVGDTEREMDILRHFKQAQVFRLLAQDLEGLMSVELLSDHLSALADLILSKTLRLCWRRVADNAALPPRLAVIGYGKLGGKELGYASDLDIIFLFESGNEGAPDRYARLAQRMVSWLTTLTPAGVLYETDLRLRPDGEKGLMVSSIEGFQKYQQEHAWVWEHQALTRARYSAGDAAVGAAFEKIRLDILMAERDLTALKKEVVSMRERMRANRRPTAMFDVKHSRGGIIDAEFIVQYLILAYAHRHPDLARNLGTIAHLKMAADFALIPRELAYASADSYREFRRLQHLARLNDQRDAQVEKTAVAHYSAPIEALWNAVFS
jgi:glutamate-ammonia-ligase adenylyltransferase